ncbi:Tyrosine recombinase XerC [bioreactor metagenome]|uniref:Tyrosine recombinase XerC n=1 Tax=bioreactor metagenome TaxID=1076179 RepID=A0A645EV42_9ZZZZ
MEYLESRSTGEGALTFYKRFKKVIKYAVEHNVITKNPCTGVVCKVDENALTKDILSVEEMKKLINTKYPEQNPETRRAFIFTLYTGIRFCDLIELKFSNVDYSNKILKFNQAKTKGKSSTSWVNIPLNGTLLSLIGEKPENEDYIFHLPSQTMCLKTLRHWVKRAGIDKHITWHGGRHSFAVNILNNGANIKTVASLLGHSGLKHTEKYTRAVDSLKEAAINSLPKLEL